MAFKFEKLIAWQKALELGVTVHEMTRSFPSEEKYIMTSQIMRAVDSINFNIAEGSTGQTNKQFSVFLGYAIRSGIEVVAALHACKARKLITDEQFVKVYKQTEEVIKITQGLRKSLN